MRSRPAGCWTGWLVLNFRPVLWKKIKTGLSAGRVQSVAVRLVVEREREIEKFKAESAFKITAQFEVDNGKKLEAELPTTFQK